MEKDNGNIGNDKSTMPMWIKILLQAGFPIFVALYFMGFFDAAVPTTIGAHQRQLENQTVKIAAIENIVGDSRRILRQICLNGAKTELAQNECQR